MKIYRKRMDRIVKGEVVAGDVRGWWRITDIDISSGGSVVMTGLNTATGETGWVWGNEKDVRDLAG